MLIIKLSPRFIPWFDSTCSIQYTRHWHTSPKPSPLSLAGHTSLAIIQCLAEPMGHLACGMFGERLVCYGNTPLNAAFVTNYSLDTDMPWTIAMQQGMKHNLIAARPHTLSYSFTLGAGVVRISLLPNKVMVKKKPRTLLLKIITLNLMHNITISYYTIR